MSYSYLEIPPGFRYPISMPIKKYYINTLKKQRVIAITVNVDYAIAECAAKQGLATLTLPQSGAALVIQNTLKKETTLSIAANSTLLPRTITVPIIDGKLALDPYEEIMLIELTDEEKRRELIVHILKEDEKAAAEKSPPGAPERKK